MARAWANVSQHWVVTSSCYNCCGPTVLSAVLANNFSTSTCFAVFKLIKFMCFGSTLIYPHEEFLNPRPLRTHTQSIAGFRTRPANAGTRNPRGLIRPAQDSSTMKSEVWVLFFRMWKIISLSHTIISSCISHTIISSWSWIVQCFLDYESLPTISSKFAKYFLLFFL